MLRSVMPPRASTAAAKSPYSSRGRGVRLNAKRTEVMITRPRRERLKTLSRYPNAQCSLFRTSVLKVSVQNISTLRIASLASQP